MSEQEMQLYVGSKLIRALPMNRQDYNDFRGWELPEDENGADEGFLVEYLDGGRSNTEQFEGYVSWSPKPVFENAYKASGGMSFSAAIELLKSGFKMARKGWNGKGMYIYHVPANSYPASRNDHSTMAEKFPGDMIPYRDYLAMKTAQDDVVPWVASQSDMLSEDWKIVE